MAPPGSDAGGDAGATPVEWRYSDSTGVAPKEEPNATRIITIIYSNLVIGGITVGAMDVSLLHEVPGIGGRELLHQPHRRCVLVDVLMVDQMGRPASTKGPGGAFVAVLEIENLHAVWGAAIHWPGGGSQVGVPAVIDVRWCYRRGHRLVPDGQVHCCTTKATSEP